MRPMRLDGARYVIGEPAFPATGKYLYGVPEIINRPNDTVWIVEGEICADALAALGLLAITSGASESVGKTDWELLRGRNVKIWADNDPAGQVFLDAVVQKLLPLGCNIQIIDIVALALPPKGDAVDWLAMNPAVTATDVENLNCAPVEPSGVGENSSRNEKEPRSNQTAVLIAFCQERFELFHNPNRDAYAKDNATGEIYRLSSNNFRDTLTASFYTQTQKIVAEKTFREMQSTLAGLARHQGECHDVYVRTAGKDGVYYIDLGEFGKSNAIKISKDGWEMIENPPVRFLRPESMRALPVPERGGDINLLWQIANIPQDRRLLVPAWICDCLRPDTPYPVMELIGEHGTAKSTSQIAIRRVIDPNACDLRSIPKSSEDIYVTAGSNCIVSYENVSHLSPVMQDALCMIATGAGYAARRLYTDAEENIIAVKRPIILNGIAAAVTAQDLVDRTISIELPVIGDRQEGTSLWQRYDEYLPKLFGALLDLMVGALKNLPDIQIPRDQKPRLIEFARFGMAMTKALGRPPEDFLTEFNAARNISLSRTLDASPVATAVREWIDDNPRGAAMPCKDFMMQMDRYKPPHGEGWPRTPKGFGDALRRAAPALRQLGIECKASPKIGGNILWEIRPIEKSSNSNPACPDVLIRPTTHIGHSGYSGHENESFSSVEDSEERAAIMQFDGSGQDEPTI